MFKSSVCRFSSVLKHFATLTRNHLCWSLFLIKLTAFNTSVFLWILRDFKEQLFYRTPLLAASTDCDSLQFAKIRFIYTKEKYVLSQKHKVSNWTEGKSQPLTIATKLSIFDDVLLLLLLTLNIFHIFFLVLLLLTLNKC